MAYEGFNFLAAIFFVFTSLPFLNIINVIDDMASHNILLNT